MKRSEPAETPPREGLTRQIRDFWSRNVNAERIMGRDVAVSERGSDDYFRELVEQRYRSHRHLRPWIQSMRPGRSVLEIGCGVGLDSFELASHGLEVTAVDVTRVAAATARDRFVANGLVPRFGVADACALPFPDEHFDYVYSFGVLHHTADTEGSIDEVRRVLRPGGEARIMLYHRRSLNEVVHRLTGVYFEERREACPVVRRFTRAETAAMFSDYASCSIDVEYLYGEGYGKLFEVTPDWLYDSLSRRIGWHLMIRATR